MDQNDFKENNLYYYKMYVDRVIDGDTFVGRLDLGFKMIREDVHVRMLHINAPEMRSKNLEEKRKAYEARSLLIGLIENKEVVIHSTEYDAFGRILANVYIDYECINETMVSLKAAKKFEG